ncbi:hypothetical protein N7533_007820 [Penicillium manginii]|uniref:uncharacterized protein n=1 Tax=Penicillium manginii TaxID=203109 RepID=UPI0025475AA1|nr:uncharacterized protein N7533_007820 [Penicillium manginii]KAJ5750792.1 hypothetical protein N7533_007820 [Penicillium manginii]
MRVSHEDGRAGPLTPTAVKQVTPPASAIPLLYIKEFDERSLVSYVDQRSCVVIVENLVQIVDSGEKLVSMVDRLTQGAREIRHILLLSKTRPRY